MQSASGRAPQAFGRILGHQRRVKGLLVRRRGKGGEAGPAVGTGDGRDAGMAAAALVEMLVIVRAKIRSRRHVRSSVSVRVRPMIKNGRLV